MGIEKPHVSQQGFNESVYKYIENLKTEKEQLKTHIRQLEKELEDAKNHIDKY